MKPSYVIENASTLDIPALVDLLAVLFGIEVDYGLWVFFEIGN